MKNNLIWSVIPHLFSPTLLLEVEFDDEEQTLEDTYQNDWYH